MYKRVIRSRQASRITYRTTALSPLVATTARDNQRLHITRHQPLHNHDKRRIHKRPSHLRDQLVDDLDLVEGVGGAVVDHGEGKGGMIRFRFAARGVRWSYRVAVVAARMGGVRVIDQQRSICAPLEEDQAMSTSIYDLGECNDTE